MKRCLHRCVYVCVCGLCRFPSDEGQCWSKIVYFLKCLVWVKSYGLKTIRCKSKYVRLIKVVNRSDLTRGNRRLKKEDRSWWQLANKTVSTELLPSSICNWQTSSNQLKKTRKHKESMHVNLLPRLGSTHLLPDNSHTSQCIFGTLGIQLSSVFVKKVRVTHSSVLPDVINMQISDAIR